MRIHPTILAPKAARWQFPLAFACLFFLLIVTIMRGPKQQVIAQAPQEKKIRVVVAKRPIEPGLPLEKAVVVLEERPLSTLPADAITSLDALKEKVAAGPIPAGYPLAVTLLADPVPVVTAAVDMLEEVPEDPVETLLKEIERDTVAIPLRFNAEAPPRGTRVVVTLPGYGGRPIIVSEDSWITKATGREAVVRLDPVQALVLHAAKSRGDGSFSFIDIAQEGQSPYVGKAVKSEDELKAAMDGNPQPTGKGRGGRNAAESEKNGKKSLTGYAWVAGEEGHRFGIDGKGEIYLLSPDGKRIVSSINRFEADAGVLPEETNE